MCLKYRMVSSMEVRSRLQWLLQEQKQKKRRLFILSVVRLKKLNGFFSGGAGVESLSNVMSLRGDKLPEMCAIVESHTICGHFFLAC